MQLTGDSSTTDVIVASFGDTSITVSDSISCLSRNLLKTYFVDFERGNFTTLLIPGEIVDG